MPNRRDFVEHVVELAGGAGRASTRAMFGGHGLYVDGRIVGILVDDVLYLKTDAQTQPSFAALGLPRFEYATRGGKRTAMSYHRAPDEALESAEAMREWIRGAQGAALRAAAGAPAARRSRAVRPRA